VDHIEAGKYWEANAEGWTRMARAGYDKCRDLYNTPTFLGILPEVRGLSGLDIGCGEGANTRRLAGLGARMTGIDIAPTFIRYARQAEAETPLGIAYQEASALELPFEDESFDFATAFMSLQDMPEQDRALAEAFRVLRPGGFFQFSMIHPCFQTPRWGWVFDEAGRKVAVTVGDYFRENRVRVEEWTFGAAPKEMKEKYPKFKTPYFERTLSDWLNLVIDAGFVLEQLAEPSPTDEVLREHPEEYDARIIAFFLIVRGRKPAVASAQETS
jgi:ubiquinone/menaquinone biosynthesis C-methylase UbiE